MKKFKYAIAGFGLTVLTLALPACSDDDKEKEEPQPPVETIADVLKRDVATGSISQQEFESKVFGKVWVRGDFSYVDTDGVDYGEDDRFMLDGGILNEHTVAYCFNKDAYVKFYTPSFVNFDGNYNHRTDVRYTYNPQTGMVYSDNGTYYDIKGETKKVLFYVESVTDDTMIVHEEYVSHPLTDGDERPDYFNIYSRQILKAVSEQEAQTNWWDKYIAD